MGVRRLVMCTAAALIVLTGAADEDAAAVECGHAATPGGGPTIGALTLLEKPSTLINAFEKETNPQNLALIFKVSGCTLPLSRAPAARPLPDDDAPASFDTVVRRGDISPERVSDNRLNVIITVNPEELKPGSYGALIQVSADFLTPSLTPVTVSRSEEVESVEVV